jgi:hypothetical protein
MQVSPKMTESATGREVRSNVSAIKFASFDGFKEIGRGRVAIRYECAAEPAGFSIR